MASTPSPGPDSVQPAGSPLREGARIVIAAATFNRPAGLAQLLDGIARLRFESESLSPTIVIVDNSPDANARRQVEDRAASYPFALRYSHQSERGIAHARNRALEEAAALDADWLAFLDDDEYPAPEWLLEMAKRAQASGATAVVGALRPDWEETPPRWVDRGGFLSIERYAEGQVLDFGNTSNVLIDMRFVRRHGLHFDLAFSLTGGEDTLFFETMLAKGGTIVFSRSGVVHETIVPHRATLGWLVKRWTRSGNTDGRILLRADPSLKGRVGKVLGGGLARLVKGGGMAILTSPAALAGHAHVPIEHLRVASRGVGFLMSGVGSTIEEYKTMRR